MNYVVNNSNVTAVGLYLACKEDRQLMPNGEGGWVAPPKTEGSKPSSTMLRLRGLAFQVDGQYAWDVDPPELVTIARWIDSYCDAAFRGRFQTTRTHGFAIYFARSGDAGSFLQQCVLNNAVFTDEQSFPEPPRRRRRTATTKLPGAGARSLSRAFPASLCDELYVRVEDPFAPGSFSIAAKLLQSRLPPFVKHDW